MQSFIDNAPTIALIFFFVVFIGITIWAMRPGAKSRLEALAQIPLKEDE